jgi:hypothetical protein
MSQHCIFFDGVQGTGKTFNTLYFGVLYADSLWHSLRVDYKLNQPFSNLYYNSAQYDSENGVYYGTEDDVYKFICWLATKDSVEFYTNECYIPCLYGNVELLLYGKKPIPLSVKHFQQEIRLAEFNMKILDEGALMLSNSMRTNNGFKDDRKVNEINEYLSTDRQNTNGYTIGNDQRQGEMFNGFRAIVNETRYLTEQQDILRPKLIEKIKNYYENKLINLDVNTSRKLSNRIWKFRKLYYSIGFRKFYYIKSIGMDGKVHKSKEIESYVLASDVPFKYDERIRRKGYKAKDKPLTI